jgi:hypothetical protein
MGKGDPGRPIATTDPLMGSLPIIASGKGFCHLAHLLQGLGTMEPQTLFGERAMVPLHKPILLGVMWLAEEHRDPEGLTKTDEGGRKVTALFRKRLGDGHQSRLCGKVGADMMSHQHRGALINDIERFYHMLLFAVRVSRDAGGVECASSCRCSHRWGAFDRISHRREARGNASMFA